MAGFRILWGIMLMAAAAACTGVQRSATRAGGQGDWPQCWRFAKVAADTFPMLGAPSPYKLFSDGLASVSMDSSGPRPDPDHQARAEWHDGDGVRLIGVEAIGFWGHFVAIAEPSASQSPAVASGYSDFGYPEYRFDVLASRFPCDEATWYPSSR